LGLPQANTPVVYLCEGEDRAYGSQQARLQNMLNRLQAPRMEGASHMVSFGKHLHLAAPAQEGEALVRLDYEEAAEGCVGQNDLTLHQSRL
jgi:hypothetical protein